MPTARLSTAKTVARGTAPLVASVRGLNLPPQPIFPVGSPEEIRLSPQVEVLAFPARLGDGLVLDLPIEFLERLPIQDLGAAIPPIPIADEPLVPHGEGVQTGRRFGPGAPSSADPAGVIDILRPLVELPVSSAEAPAAPPSSLRPYQIEAVQALLAQDGLLLADELGTGKTVAVCQAILALVQRGQARRSLVVCPGHMLRYWRDRLTEWAPSLVTSWIRGNRKERASAWQAAAHVLLIDYSGLAEDIEKGVSGPDLSFDIVVMDDLHLLPDLDNRVEAALSKLEAARRWGLGGLLPSDPDAWRVEFGCLLPGRPHPATTATAGELQKWFMPNVLRRSRAQLRSQLPEITRQERWIDLSFADFQASGEAMAEERHRLEANGPEVSQQDIDASWARLKVAMSFPGGRGSAKLEALLDLLDEVVRDGRKVIVQSVSANIDHLLPVLGPYGVVAVREDQTPEDRISWLRMFREPSGAQVLVTESSAIRGLGPFPEVSLLVLFDPEPDPAARLAVEATVRPQPGDPAPLHSIELWTIGTVDERVAELLDSRGIPLEPSGTAVGLTQADWIEKIYAIRPAEAVRREAPALPKGTGVLPGTDLLRSQLQHLAPAELLSGVGQWMQALGFPQVEELQPATETGGELLAWRDTDIGIERILVRCVRTTKNVGVAEAKALLKALEARADCLGGYLVVTTDFTPACKKAADESGGRLALVSGAELWRHLHIQGLLSATGQPPTG